ncbi:MAG: F0F1 ATP synthase subunit I [Alphaproteobacteria bacterium MedPE-SWcel]|nr:MAG: F0F1 ATP synthase subunit I [Alphaproteobacteria bacterium MedPE-SWcel]
MIDDDQKQRMAQLEEKLAAAKQAHEEPAPRADEHYSMANQAWRMVTELVAGLVIGLGIGYGLDVLLGTMPIFMVLFIMLGLAAGVKVMLRSAGEIQDKQMAEAEKHAKADKDA